MPEENEKDLADIPKNITGALKIHTVRWIDQVLDLALERPLAPAQARGEQGAGESDVPREGAADENAPVRPH
jgi:ATP-dependent Lon protease